MGAFVPLIQFKISNYSQLTNTIWGVDNLLIVGMGVWRKYYMGVSHSSKI